MIYEIAGQAPGLRSGEANLHLRTRDSSIPGGVRAHWNGHLASAFFCRLILTERTAGRESHERSTTAEMGNHLCTRVRRTICPRFRIKIIIDLQK